MKTPAFHRHAPPVPPSQKGWTALELIISLVVVAVITLLAFPIYRKAALSAGRTRCASNLRHVGIATLLYIRDHNQQIVSQTGGGNISFGWTKQLVFNDYIPKDKPYLLLRCPGAKYQHSIARYNPAMPGSSASWFWETYGLAMFPIPQATFTPVDDRGYNCVLYSVSMAAIPDPANHLLLADSSGGAPDHWQTFSMQTKAGPKAGGTGGVGLRHGDRANAFYLDGHMEAVDAARAEASGVPTTRIYHVPDPE
ncbi:MAG TPA: hypothetical protein VNQ90_14440 [Chthoniobacteraceae bacterium]|nr:hypothetical protein [Chthoniobacteraceae bacterium]